MHFITDLILNWIRRTNKRIYYFSSLCILPDHQFVYRGKYIAIYNDLERTCSAKNEKFETDLLNK